MEHLYEVAWHEVTFPRVCRIYTIVLEVSSEWTRKSLAVMSFYQINRKSRTRTSDPPHPQVWAKTKSKHRKNPESCPTQVTWKIKFRCQICLSDLSVLSVPYIRGADSLQNLQIMLKWHSRFILVFLSYDIWAHSPWNCWAHTSCLSILGHHHTNQAFKRGTRKCVNSWQNSQKI